ncbi:MAG: DoxX family protein [Haloferacaceae archaeon]
MSTDAKQASWFGNSVEFDYADTVAGYAIVAVRLITGYWMLHAGIGKLTGPEAFSAAGWLTGATQGTLVAPITVWAGQTPWMLAFTNFMIPVGETLIGLGILLGAMTRLAAFFGGFLMVFFYLGNADFAHGYVNGDLFSLLMFVIIGTFAAGRIFGVDTYLEKTEFVKNNRWLKYLLG